MSPNDTAAEKPRVPARLPAADSGHFSLADLIDLEELPHHTLFPVLAVQVADLAPPELGASYVIVALPAGQLRSLLQLGLRGQRAPILIGQASARPSLPVARTTPNSPPEEALLEPLSPRELDVLQLMAHGASNQAVARGLTISPATAKKHVSNILRKLGVRNRTQAVARGRSLGLCG